MCWIVVKESLLCEEIKLHTAKNVEYNVHRVTLNIKYKTERKKSLQECDMFFGQSGCFGYP